MCFNKYKYKRIRCENIAWLTLVYGKIIDWSLQTNCIDILISSLLKWRKVSCVGFITRCPFTAIATRRMLRSWPVNRRKRQSPVLCLNTPFPQKYKVSFGVPIMGNFSQWHMCVAPSKTRLPHYNGRVLVRKGHKTT